MRAPPVQATGEWRGDGAVEFVKEPELRPQIFEPDDPEFAGEAVCDGGELAELDKATRGDDGAQPDGAAGRQQAIGAGGVVQHRRHSPGRLQGEKRDRGADRVRQHDADLLAARRRSREPAAEHQARGDQAIVAQRRPRGVLDDAVRAAMRGTGVE